MLKCIQFKKLKKIPLSNFQKMQYKNGREKFIQLISIDLLSNTMKISNLFKMFILES